MTRDEFIAAMGGQQSLDERGLAVIPCACGHECCQGWNVEEAA